MEEDIEVLEEMLNIDKYLGKFLSDNRRQAIENLIKGYKELEKKNNNVADRLEYYLIDNFAIMKNPNKIKEELEKLLNMLQEGDK